MLRLGDLKKTVTLGEVLRVIESTYVNCTHEVDLGDFGTETLIDTAEINAQEVLQTLERYYAKEPKK